MSRTILRVLTAFIALILVVNLDAQQRIRLRSVAPISEQLPPGPSASITCPGGADVNVAAANPDQIQEAINANSAGTTYCLGAGEHRLTTELVPKSGDTFIGEFGAILDGTGWTSADVDDAAFKITSTNVDDVTIRNLTIRDLPQKGIHADGNAAASGWLIEHNDIGFCGNLAVSLPDSSTAQYNLLHDCGNGAYGAFRSSDTMWLGNHIYNNGSIHKFVATISTVFSNNYLYDNEGDGIWFDTANILSVVEDNIVENSGRHGIHVEITGSIVVDNNTVTGSVDTGIMIVTSFDGTYTNNTLSGNARGIRFYVKPDVIDGVPKENMPDGYQMENNSVDSNSITVTDTNHWANGLSADPQGSDITEYLDGVTKGNTMTNNDYFVPASYSKWLWGSSVTFKTWTQWRALNSGTLDATGSCTVTGGGVC